MKLAVIPARGGSKRIPRKNVKDFIGRPMIAWSIAAARASGCFDRIEVSTDDAEPSFIRPPKLADDHTPTISMIAHTIQWHLDRGEAVGAELLQQRHADYAFAATCFPFPIQRAFRLTANGHVEIFQPEHFNTRSQYLEQAFHDAGQFNCGQTTAWLSGKTFWGANSVPVFPPRYRVQDIDHAEDRRRAEALFRVLHEAS